MDELENQNILHKALYSKTALEYVKHVESYVFAGVITILVSPVGS